MLPCEDGRGTAVGPYRPRTRGDTRRDASSKAVRERRKMARMAWALGVAVEDMKV